MWEYQEYSDWSRSLAKTTTYSVLVSDLNRLLIAQDKAKASHLAAIQRSSSMTSNSQRRAQSRNVVTGNYERIQALKSAIEIHGAYPLECKQ